MPNPVDAVGDFLRSALLIPVVRDHNQTDAAFRRRRWVTLATLIVGAACLTWALRIEPGDPLFYWATLLMALIWTVGAVASGPLHLGWGHTRDSWRTAAGPASVTDSGADPVYRRPWVTSFALGLGLLAVFLGGAAMVRFIPPLRNPVLELLDHAGEGSLALVALLTAVNGVAEELFFRGALYAAVGRRHAILLSTIAYALVTATSGILLLVFAAALLGLLVGLQRRVTGGVLGPIITHLTWSLGMLFLLPYVLT